VSELSLDFRGEKKKKSPSDWISVVFWKCIST
jgi:hypothetical protein